MKKDTYVLELNKVGRRFGSEPVVYALIDIDLRLKPGEWLAVTGPSGAGKSTLLNVLGCLDHPTSGEYLFEGINTAALSDDERAGLRSRRIGFVFQSYHLLSHRTVLENVMLAEVYRQQDQAGRRERALAALDRVGLSHRVDFMPTKLSGGEKQRVAIARAFAAEPELVVCDEPLSALDVSVQAAVLNLLVELQARTGAAYLFISHDLSVVRYLADRVAVMYMGKLCEVGRVDDLFAPPYHPYTEALLSAIPLPDPRSVQRKVRLEGPVPSPVDPGPGCRFQSRCPRKVGAVCETEPPPAREAAPGHVIVCHIPLEELRRVPPVIEDRPAAAARPGGS